MATSMQLWSLRRPSLNSHFMFAKLTRSPSRGTQCLFLISLLGVMSWGLLAPGAFRFLRTDPSSPWALLNDCLLHFAVFAFATLSCGLMFGRHDMGRLWGIAIAFVILGTVTECLQAFIPTRTCDPIDCLANVSGVAAGFKLAAMYFREQRQAPQPARLRR